MYVIKINIKIKIISLIIFLQIFIIFNAHHAVLAG